MHYQADIPDRAEYISEARCFSQWQPFFVNAHAAPHQSIVLYFCTPLRFTLAPAGRTTWLSSMMCSRRIKASSGILYWTQAKVTLLSQAISCLPRSRMLLHTTRSPTSGAHWRRSTISSALGMALCVSRPVYGMCCGGSGNPKINHVSGLTSCALIRKTILIVQVKCN